MIEFLIFAIPLSIVVGVYIFVKPSKPPTSGWIRGSQSD